MNDMTIFANNIVRMTSREIAELTGKPHKHVIRDVRVMLDQLYGDGPNLGHEGIQGVTMTKDARGYTAEISLDKLHTFNLVTGYNAKMRMAILRRWDELEARVAEPEFKIPQTYTEALRLAADLADQVGQLEEQVETLEPKAQFHDEVHDASGLMSMGDAANRLQIGRTTLFHILRVRGVLKQDGGAYNTPYQAYIDRGYFKVKSSIYKTHGQGHVAHTTYVTPKGMTYLFKLLRNW